jgi:DNA-binding SARP family transcriptional activator
VPAPVLRLRLAGVPTLVTAQGRPVFLEPQGALIAARIALAGAQPRAELAALLWPEAEPARARANLRQRLLRVKAQAGIEWVVGSTRLDLAEGVMLEPLQPALEEPDPPPLLQGVPEPSSEELARWLAAAREAQLHERVAALQRAVAAAEAEPDARPEAVLALIRRLVALQPHAESHRRALMRQHYVMGDLAQALVTYRELRTLLDDEFGTRPDAETEALHRLIASSAARPPDAAGSGQPAGAPAVRSGVQAALQRPPRLVGRAAERSALLEAACGRRAALLLGEAGLGKSRLLSEVLPVAQARGLQVLMVKARAGDAGVPYSTLARLLRERLAQLGEGRAPRAGRTPLGRLLPELAPDGAPPAPAEGDRLQLQQAVLALFELGDRGEQGPAGVVAVDDLHFADEASLEMLHALIGGSAGSRWGWLLTQRPGEGPAAAQALREGLGTADRLALVELRALAEAEMSEMVGSLGLPGIDAAELGPRLARHCGGNPLFALETLKQLGSVPDNGRGAATMPSPQLAVALIERRLRQLSERALALARTAAIAGEDFGAALAADVLGRAAVELADAWAELESAQVLREGAFAHDLVQEAALRGVPQPIAKHLHEQVARHLLRLESVAAAAPARVAAHLLAAGRDGEALPWLQRAAEQARAALRPREQAGFLAPIAAYHEARGARAQAFGALMELLQARIDSGLPPDALEVLARAEAVADSPTERARVRTQRGYVLGQFGRRDEAVSELRAALADALPTGDGPLIVEVLGTLAAAISLHGGAEQAERLLNEHWHWVERTDTPGQSIWGHRALILDRLGRVREARRFHDHALEDTLRHGRTVEHLSALGNLVTGLVFAGERAAAEAVLRRLEQMWRQHEGIAASRAALVSHGANVARESHHYGRALGLLDEVAAQSSERAFFATWAAIQRGRLWCAIGQWARARRELSQLDLPGLSGPNRGRVLQAMAWVARGLGHDPLPLLDQAAEAVPPGVDGALAAAVRLQRSAWACTSAGATPGQTGPMLATLRAQVSEFETLGLVGLAWAARWHAAQIALHAGQSGVAAELALQCGALDMAERSPRDIGPGVWWHGLWRLWRALGEGDRGEAARAEGVAWIHRCLRDDLAPEFRPAFKESVREHRELLLG